MSQRLPTLEPKINSAHISPIQFHPKPTLSALRVPRSSPSLPHGRPCTGLSASCCSPSLPPPSSTRPPRLVGGRQAPPSRGSSLRPAALRTAPSACLRGVAGGPACRLVRLPRARAGTPRAAPSACLAPQPAASRAAPSACFRVVAGGPARCPLRRPPRPGRRPRATPPPTASAPRPAAPRDAPTTPVPWLRAAAAAYAPPPCDAQMLIQAGSRANEPARAGKRVEPSLSSGSQQ